MTLFSWVLACVKESLETLLKSFFPEKFFISVLVDKFWSGVLNIFEVIENQLHGSVKFELILNLDQVVALTCIETSDLNSNGNKVIDDALQ